MQGGTAIGLYVRGIPRKYWSAGRVAGPDAEWMRAEEMKSSEFQELKR
jgi:hypothetical protein